jgi:hypothetical protein
MSRLSPSQWFQAALGKAFLESEEKLTPLLQCRASSYHWFGKWRGGSSQDPDPVGTCPAGWRKIPGLQSAGYLVVQSPDAQLGQFPSLKVNTLGMQCRVGKAPLLALLPLCTTPCLSPT